MTVSREEKLNSLQKALSQAKEKRIKAETQLEELNKQEANLLAECQELGVDPDKLEEACQETEKEFDNLYSEAVKMIPWEELGIPEPLK